MDMNLVALIVFHLLVAPYTKVEESFNIQATHDVLVYGTPTSNVYEKLSSAYDHFTFPGAVPRTFVGPVILAGISQPVITLLGFKHAQTIVRLMLGLFNAYALSALKWNIQRAHGRSAARWFTLLQASQFHVMFYASRTLPNMFAFGLTTLAYAQILSRSASDRIRDPYGIFGRQRLAVSLLVFAAVIFRSEVAILLFTLAVYLIAVPFTSLEVLTSAFLVSFPMALLISVPLDSYFWQKPLWPELWGFYYNAVLGSSSAWGVSPWHYYFTSALPRLLLNPLVYLLLIPTAWRQVSTSSSARLLTIPPLLFVAIYSLQPHKEARFIFYVVPPLTAAAALGANHIYTRRNKTLLLRLTSILLVVSVLASFAASIAMSYISSLNYPGGEALAHLRWQFEGTPASGTPGYEPEQPREVHVHADVLSCMTGVTLFGTSSGTPGRSETLIESGKQRDSNPRRIVLDKTEDPARLADPSFWLQFDYVLAEDPMTVKGGEWDEVAVVEGYAGVEILQPGMGDDVEKAQDKRKVVGKGARVAALRDKLRTVTGGWWVGPRMAPKIHILRRVKGGRGRGQGVQS
ncbi:hypothetical protein BR93DRAFT_960379 [Coniochaeta sp. PMI_546]|nr:hypothetical protein BR93DRAFT_960379 [Coniochaeta sp. PMI_546]